MTSAPATKTSEAIQSPTTGHLAQDGIDYYYEIHGQGEPLLLLHGGLMSGASFHPLLPALTEKHKVILVDLQGHGRTTLGDRPITLANNAKDLDALLDKLGISQTDVVGYSFGGGTALQLAAHFPSRVRKLVIMSAPYTKDGFYPEMLPQHAAVSSQMLPMMKDSPLYQQYVAVAPKDDFGPLLDRMGAVMRDWNDASADVKKIVAPTMLVFGDSDMVHFDHITSFYKLLGGGQKDAGWQREHMATNRLAIIPDATHYDILYSPLLVPTIRHFLDGATTVSAR